MNGRLAPMKKGKEKKPEKKPEKFSNLLMGCIEVCFVIATISAMIRGEGFHLRQGWRGISNTTESGQLNYECGNFPKVLRANPHLSNCNLPGFPKINNASSFEGYYGSARWTSNMWQPLGMGQQYYILITCVLILPITFTVMCANFGWEKHWKLVAMILCALLMTMVASFQVYLMMCPGYKDATMRKFENHIQKLKVVVKEYDKVVICYVEGFFIASFFATFAVIAYTIDVIIYIKLIKGMEHRGAMAENPMRVNKQMLKKTTPKSIPVVPCPPAPLIAIKKIDLEKEEAFLDVDGKEDKDTSESDESDSSDEEMTIQPPTNASHIHIHIHKDGEVHREEEIKGFSKRFGNEDNKGDYGEADFGGSGSHSCNNYGSGEGKNKAGIEKNDGKQKKDENDDKNKGDGMKEEKRGSNELDSAENIKDGIDKEYSAENIKDGIDKEYARRKTDFRDSIDTKGENEAMKEEEKFKDCDGVEAGKVIDKKYKEDGQGKIAAIDGNCNKGEKGEMNEGKNMNGRAGSWEVKDEKEEDGQRKTDVTNGSHYEGENKQGKKNNYTPKAGWNFPRWNDDKSKVEEVKEQMKVNDRAWKVMDGQDEDDGRWKKTVNPYDWFYSKGWKQGTTEKQKRGNNESEKGRKNGGSKERGSKLYEKEEMNDRCEREGMIKGKKNIKTDSRKDENKHARSNKWGRNKRSKIDETNEKESAGERKEKDEKDIDSVESVTDGKDKMGNKGKQEEIDENKVRKKVGKNGGSNKGGKMINDGDGERKPMEEIYQEIREKKETKKGSKNGSKMGSKKGMSKNERSNKRPKENEKGSQKGGSNKGGKERRR